MVVALAGCQSSAPTPPITPSPEPATPTATATATPTPTPTPTPADTPSPSPTPSPTSAAAACTGTADQKAYLAGAAAVTHFDVYCAVLPAGWWLDSGSAPNPDWLDITYKSSGGAVIILWEGGWCPAGHACAEEGGPVGPASFGGLTGTLYSDVTSFFIHVGTFADQKYKMSGQGMTEAQFRAWAAALVKVPKP
jgi:hypothetical protein